MGPRKFPLSWWSCCKYYFLQTFFFDSILTIFDHKIAIMITIIIFCNGSSNLSASMELYSDYKRSKNWRTKKRQNSVRFSKNFCWWFGLSRMKNIKKWPRLTSWTFCLFFQNGIEQSHGSKKIVLSLVHTRKYLQIYYFHSNSIRS